MEPGLVHQAEKTERPERDRLAAGIRTGHHECGVAVTESDVDRDDAAGEAGVACRQQDDLGSVGGLGAGGVHVGGE